MAGCVVVAILIVLAEVVATSRAGGPSYRTASVERADVDATLDSLGTIQPINEANLSFPVAGSVRSVSAAVGQHVTVGQTLAQLDTTSLDAQVASARSAVATAQARLAADGSSQTSGTSTTAVAPAALITETTGPSDPPSAARELVAKQQARLIADQRRADKDLATEQRDLKTEASLCQAFLTSADGGKARTSSNPRLSDGTATPRWPDASGCESALQTVLADQVAVDHAQRAVTTDIPALDDAVDKLLTTTRPSAQPASAEQLASDQAAVDAAQAQLAEAQQAHDQAELRCPIDGTVGSVTISAGQSIQPSSGTPQIVVIGEGSHQVITSVSDTNVGSVRVGDTATVTPSGSAAPLRGQVISVGLLASGSSASSGSVSYPVTIGLTNIEQQLFAGQSASVSIMLAHASGALTVPSSAVHTAGANNIVTVLRGGTPHNVQVTLGAIGPIRTQVLTGLNPGDQVILADLSQPLPTTNLQNIRRLAGGGGGRPGG